MEDFDALRYAGRKAKHYLFKIHETAVSVDRRIKPPTRGQI